MPRRVIVRPFIARLYPERGSSLFALVQVWPTKASMLAHVNAYHHTMHGNKFGARTQATCGAIEIYKVRKGQPRRKSPCFASVNFWRGRLGIGVVTHELLHATLRWAGRVGYDLSQIRAHDCTMHEERIVYVHGEMCRQFTAAGLRPGGFYEDRDLVQARQ
jgi:hypothetical protein